MADKRTQWGLHSPLSTALPTPEEVAQDEAMIEELKRQNNFESTEETERRTQVLKTLQTITAEFLREVGRKKGLSETQIKDLGGKITTFGSFRLGVFGPGSDIDTLIVSPKYITREDWFDHFPAILERMSKPGTIEQMKSVRESFVPIIKLEYSGISIDLLFASLQVSSVPFNLDLRDDSLVRQLDDVELRCVNGTRVTDMILTLVPQKLTFRHALRVVKLWAQRRAIYANIAGFPGGVAWAMMVAFICQLYPQACGSVLVGKFFNIMRTWPWPRPIQLKKPTEPTPGMAHRIWNPVQYNGDRAHLMPIITPAYPEMCATHNISQSSKKIILKELDRAEGITKQIHEGKRPWSDLFQKHTFFTLDYKYYLSIIASSKNKEAHHSWAGLVESKVRRLASGIEISQPGIGLARTFTKGFDRVHQCRNEEEIAYVLHGKLDYMVKDGKSNSIDLASDTANVDAIAENRAVIANGMSDVPQTNGKVNGEPNGHGGGEASNDRPMATIYTTTYYIGLELSKDAKSLDISYPVTDFTRQCITNSQYDADTNAIKVIHTRKYVSISIQLFYNALTRK